MFFKLYSGYLYVKNCITQRKQLLVVYGYVALVVDDDVKLFHGVVVPA